MPKGTRGTISNIDFLVGTTTHPPSQGRGETVSPLIQTLPETKSMVLDVLLDQRLRVDGNESPLRY